MNIEDGSHQIHYKTKGAPNNNFSVSSQRNFSTEMLDTLTNPSHQTWTTETCILGTKDYLHCKAFCEFEIIKLHIVCLSDLQAIVFKDTVFVKRHLHGGWRYWLLIGSCLLLFCQTAFRSRFFFNFQSMKRACSLKELNRCRFFFTRKGLPSSRSFDSMFTVWFGGK